jgi:hypothetical protein
VPFPLIPVGLNAATWIASSALAILGGGALLKGLGLDGSQSQKNNNLYTADSFKAPSTGLSQRSNQPRKPSDWHNTITNYRNSKNTSTNIATTTLPPSAPPLPPAPQPYVEPDPPPPPPPPAPPIYTGVLAAPIDTVVFVDEPFSENFYADVLFQDFGGQELLSIARSDTVNGQSVVYQPFKDLGIINEQYNPNKLLSIQETSDRFFANFLIKLNGKIPVVGEGPNGATVYLEEGNTGSVIIEFINIETNEQVEIQILNAGIIEDIGI